MKKIIENHKISEEKRGKRKKHDSFDNAIKSKQWKQ